MKKSFSKNNNIRKQACKNSQQNTSKENSAIYQKDKSP